MQLKSKTWIEISKKNLLHNLKVFNNIVKPKTKIMCVVKANAYGHGWEEVVSTLEDKADWFGVDSAEEAIEIRALDPKTPTLVLGKVPKLQTEELVRKKISFVLYDKGLVNFIVKKNFSKKAKVHLKIESGLNRQGLREKKILELVKSMEKNKSKFELEGTCSHFANIEDTLDPRFAMEQLKVFKRVSKKVEILWGARCIRHIAASAATMLYEESHFDMIRLGASLYGFWPSRETQVELKMKKENKFILKPALSWKSLIAQVKNIEIGESVGYGRSWYALRKSKIAIIPVGYYDGYDRGLSNNSRVLINGKFGPVVGRIAMNMFAVDVTNVGRVKEGDVVVIIGKGGKNKITIDELSERIQTINYEMTSRLNSKIKRIII